MGDTGCTCQTRRAGAMRPLDELAVSLSVYRALLEDRRTARTAASTAPFDQPVTVPEYPPRDWFAGPPTWVDRWRQDHGLGTGAENGLLPLTVTDEGRVGGWFYEHGQCIVHQQDACPGPSPTGYAAFLQSHVVCEDGSAVRVGVIGNVHGHASPWSTVSVASRHYADPDAQMIVCRAGDDDRGGWIAGALVPGLSRADLALARRCALSGDWRPMPPEWFRANGSPAQAVIAADGYDCIGPTLVTRPALPLTGPGIGRPSVGLLRAASLDSPYIVVGAPVETPAMLAALDGRLVVTATLADGTVIADESAPVSARTATLRADLAPHDEETDMGETITTARLPGGTVIETRVSGGRTAGVTSGAADLPLAPAGTAWDAAAADQRVRALASSDGSGDPTKIDWGSYGRAFLWRDDTVDPPNFGAFKLPFADVVNGKLEAVPDGISAAAGALDGAQGGVDVPAADVDGIKARLASYYDQMGEQPPWTAAPGDMTTPAPAAGPPMAPGDTTSGDPMDDGDGTNEPDEGSLEDRVSDLEDQVAGLIQVVQGMIDSQAASLVDGEADLPDLSRILASTA